MMAAAVWSLIIPAIDMSSGMGKLSFVPAAVGVMSGIIFLFSLDKVIPHLHVDSDKPEGTNKYSLKKTTKLVLAEYFIIFQRGWLWELYLHQS